MNSRLIALILPFLSYSGIFIISLFLINQGVYTSELGVYTFDNGSQWLFFIYFMMSLLVFFMFYNLSNIKNITFHISKKKESYLLNFISVLALFYFIPILLHGPAILLGMNRYQYLELPFVSVFNIKAWISLLCYVLGFLFHQNKKRTVILFMIILGTAVLYGEKGSGPLLMLTFFLSGFLMYKSKRLKLVSLFKFIAVGIVILFSIYVVQLLVLDIDLQTIINALVNRLARQSQIFWEMYNQFPFEQGRIDSALLFGRLGDSSTISTMHYMMKLVMPAAEYSKHGGSLAGGYPSVLFLLTDSYIQLLLLSMLLSIVYIVVIHFFFVSLFKVSYVFYLLPILYFGFTVHLKVFQTGNVSLFLNEKYLVVLFLSLLFCLLLTLNSFRTVNS